MVPEEGQVRRQPARMLQQVGDRHGAPVLATPLVEPAAEGVVET